MARKNRIYVDTSVFGGVFDKEFAALTELFFEEVRVGKHVLLVSDITARELMDAPSSIRLFPASVPEESLERIAFSSEMADLRDAYLKAAVVGPRWSDDAAHVAAATVARADLIVSWNFKHLVKWSKIRAFNAVNLTLGYPMMTILSPREVVSDEEDD